MRMRRIRASTMRALGVRLPVTDAPNATSKALTRQTRAHEIFSVNTIPPAQMRTGKSFSGQVNTNENWHRGKTKSIGPLEQVTEHGHLKSLLVKWLPERTAFWNDSGNPQHEFVCILTQAGGRMFKRIHHIAIICSDYPRSKRFYVEILGFEIVREVYREERKSFKLDLQVGDQYQIELFSFPNPPERRTRPEACGLRHIAFEVEDVQDTADRLRARGVQVEPIRVDEETHKSFTFCRAPDDLPIEIYER